MSLDFELTISGLCVLAIRAEGENLRPTSTSSVDVLCVGPHRGHDHDHDHGHSGEVMHRPRLSYLPEDFIPADGLVADLVVDQRGRRIASLDLTGRTLGLDLGGNPHETISLSWGPEDQTVPTNDDEAVWFNWVPSVQDLGFGAGLRLGEPGSLTEGAVAVLSLTNGTLAARNLVRSVAPPDIIEWEFPAAGGIRRAIANEVAFLAHGVGDVVITVDGVRALTSARAGGLLEVSFSNDLAVVGADFSRGSVSLHHLRDIQALAASGDSLAMRPAFQAPQVPPVQRTGHPICNQALFVFSGDGNGPV